MEADFRGYATKAGLKCSDGRTILPGAFKQQDQTQVPLVWQHGHTDPENVLGHVLLEDREDGVYAYGFFNETPKAKHVQAAVEHKDIKAMSIWANQLIERSKVVLHGAIREVSLVLSGANPGALIEHVRISHGEGLDDEELEDEAIIFNGENIEHSDLSEENSSEEQNDEEDKKDEKKVEHQDDKKTDDEEDNDEETIQDVIDTMNEKQKTVLHFMVGEAIASGKAKHDDVGDKDDDQHDGSNTDDKKGSAVTHNVFEQDQKGKTKKEVHYLSHDDIVGIVNNAQKNGSLKEAVEEYALSHGIEDIDTLFPDATAVDSVPEYLQRRTEWVAGFLGATRKSPFSRIKTLSADITEADARAKGYIKGTLKKEEFFRVAKRVTTPTTVYKKQKLDRDDLVDITDFDVVAWLKAEMRVMLDEEVARAGLIGDGRDIADEDKINEQNIRPIASDHELFTTTLWVNIDDASSSITEFIDAVVANRSQLKGTGLPTMFTTETYIAKFMLLRDTLGRRIYKSLDELATELRVAKIVPVEVLEEDDEVIAIFVNPVDYVYGATRGGEVSMFDDFDIDYNQHKYLIETRLSGALTKLKSALVVRKTAGANVLVMPNDPTFVEATGVVTIPTQTGVVYKNADTGATLSAGAQAALAAGATLNVHADPAAGYYFESSMDDDWSFTRPEA